MRCKASPPRRFTALATPARSALRWAKSTMRNAKSLPNTGARGSHIWARASSCNCRHTCASYMRSCSKPKRRCKPAAMRQAICAASITMVPLPQHGSYSGKPCSTPATDGTVGGVSPGAVRMGMLQPLAASMAAARVSFSGASPLSSRQPRLNKGSPVVSKYRVSILSVRWACTRTSGRWVSTSGRTPDLSRKRSATASLTRKVAKFKLFKGLCWAVISTLKLCLDVNHISQATAQAAL